MGIFDIIGNLFGIGKSFVEGKQKLKQAKQDQEFKIVEAETKAIVDRITSNNEADNTIDAITARNKDRTLKDEVVSYIFLTPVVIATIVPFVIAFGDGDWSDMNKYIQESYESLDSMPDWYIYVLGAIIVDILGFRSMVRKVFDKFIETRFSKGKKS